MHPKETIDKGLKHARPVRLEGGLSMRRAGGVWLDRRQFTVFPAKAAKGPAIWSGKTLN
ncbi:hypothetical protein K9U40_13275 [Xanthobacter autotrophicus]|uniref:hypothetical protein n=1 Tax=Xanthobacter TaxID=279 RepID=UPI0024AC6CF2|nr:hypothetical protein [Xanthobacter autotrophicus]MDI4665294.1 hypothetical protein [Xanthobacter autotrophicus]